MKKLTVFLLAILLFACKEENKNSMVASSQVESSEMRYALGEKALSSIIAQNSNIPYFAAYYGVDAVVELEFTIDTMGNIADIRLIREEMATTMPSSKEKNEVLQKLIGKFAADAEIALWKTSGQWVPEIKLGEKQVSSMVKEFSFNTKQNQATGDSISLSKDPIYGEFIENGSLELDARRYYEMGVKLLSYGKAPYAVKFFTACVDLVPGFVDAWFNRGLALSAMNKPKVACQSWKIAAQLGDEEAQKLVSETCGQD